MTTGQWTVAPETPAPTTGVALARIKTDVLMSGGRELAYLAKRVDDGTYDAVVKVGPHTFGNRTGLVAAGVSRDNAIRAANAAVAAWEESQCTA